MAPKYQTVALGGVVSINGFQYGIQSGGIGGVYVIRPCQDFFDDSTSTLFVDAIKAGQFCIVNK